MRRARMVREWLCSTAENLRENFDVPLPRSLKHEKFFPSGEEDALRWLKTVANPMREIPSAVMSLPRDIAEAVRWSPRAFAWYGAALIAVISSDARSKKGLARKLAKTLGSPNSEAIPSAFLYPMVPLALPLAAVAVPLLACYMWLTRKIKGMDPNDLDSPMEALLAVMVVAGLLVSPILVMLSPISKVLGRIAGMAMFATSAIVALRRLRGMEPEERALAAWEEVGKILMEDVEKIDKEKGTVISVVAAVPKGEAAARLFAGMSDERNDVSIRDESAALVACVEKFELSDIREQGEKGFFLKALACVAGASWGGLAERMSLLTKDEFENVFREIFSREATYRGGLISSPMFRGGEDEDVRTVAGYLFAAGGYELEERLREANLAMSSYRMEMVLIHMRVLAEERRGLEAELSKRERAGKERRRI